MGRPGKGTTPVASRSAPTKAPARAEPGRSAPQRAARHVPRPPWGAPHSPASPASPRLEPAGGPNRTGLSDRLKAGVEALSGLAMDDVRVHRNSGEPVKLGALAYTQGRDIHLGPGQEQHLPHEAWHVVQQKQGRVRATAQLKAGTAINDDAGLEAEADAMGALSLADPQPAAPHQPLDDAPPPSGVPAQLKLVRFKPEGPGTGPDQPLEDLAQALNTSTENAFAYVTNQIANMGMGVPVDMTTAFPHSSARRHVHLCDTLRGYNPALKSAVAGYMIEDIVSAEFRNAPGVETQYIMQNGRPDFYMSFANPNPPYTNRRGVVDITSSGEEGHIWGKGITKAGFDYIAECTYPSIQFPSVGMQFALSPASQESARTIILKKALEDAGTALNQLKDRVDLECGNPYSNGRREAGILKSYLSHLRTMTLDTAQIAAADAQVAGLNAIIVNRIAPLGSGIAAIATKYDLPVNSTPTDWEAVRQALLAPAAAAAAPAAEGAAPEPTYLNLTNFLLGAAAVAVLAAVYAMM